MSIDKLLTNVRADAQVDERYKSTGRVELRAIPSWLKSDRFITALLTPAEARALAIELLQAAERAS